jgi:hypothetical protein
MTQKLLNLANELGKYWKVFGDRYACSDGQFYANDYDIGASNGNVLSFTT